MKHALYLFCLLLMGCEATLHHDTTTHEQEFNMTELHNRALESSSEELSTIQPITYAEKPLHPAAFTDFLPDPSKGKFSTAVDLTEIKMTRKPTNQKGWYTSKRKKGKIAYQYLGKADNDWHAYLVKNQNKDKSTQTAVLFVTLTDGILKRHGATYPEDIETHQISLEGNELVYTLREAIDTLEGK